MCRRDSNNMQIYNVHKVNHAWIAGAGSLQGAWRGVLVIDIELG